MKNVSIFVSLNELCELESIEVETVVAVVEYGIAKPAKGENERDWCFDPNSVHWIKKAVRIKHDLEVDWVAVSSIIQLLRERELLRRKVRYYKSQLMRFVE